MSAQRAFAIEVDDKATAALQRAAGGLSDRVNRAVTDSAHDVQRRAVVNIRMKLNTTGLSTGNLARSVSVVADPAAFRAQVGPSAEYGRIHEYGGTISSRFFGWRTVTIPARPYLQPALDDATPGIERRITRAVEEAISGQ